MSKRKIFWGIFFITIGTIFLLVQLETIELNFGNLVLLCSITLILWGIYLFNLPEYIGKILAGILAFLIALILTTFVMNPFSAFSLFKPNFFCKYSRHTSSNIETHKFSDSLSIPYDKKIKEVNLSLETGGGQLLIADTTEKLIELHSKGNIGNYIAQSYIKDSTAEIKLFLSDSNNHLIITNEAYNSGTIKLNKEAIWSLDLSIGAMELECDLSPFWIRNLNISGGATEIKLKMGDKIDTTSISLSTGLSSVEIRIPKEAGCEITTDIGLTSTEFEEFKEIDDKVYRTPNFQTAKKIIFISIEGGLSSFKVIRY